jgi:hypothetical protein
MSAGGLSMARLGRMHDVMAGYVERGAVPGEDMVAILMTQRLGFASDLYLDFWTSAYQAIDD